MRLWLLDIAAEPGSKIDLWLKAEDGSTWIHRSHYIQNFYLVGDVKRAASLLKLENIRFEKCSRRFRGRLVEALRVYAECDDLEEYASRLVKRIGNVEVYEADIRSSAKYLLEKGLRPCSWLEVEGKLAGEEDGVHILEGGEAREAADAPPPRLRIAALDFVFFAEKGSARPDRDPIRLISISFDDGFELQLEGDERDILQSLISVIKERDPDILVGFGLNRIQWGYLLELSLIHI